MIDESSSQNCSNFCVGIAAVATTKLHSVEDLHRLTPVQYLILLALTDGERHGYALKKEIIRKTDGWHAPGQGSLYRSTRQLCNLALIEVAQQRPHRAIDDARRRYFRITRLGLQTMRLETERLAKLVDEARSSLRSSISVRST